MYIVGSVSTVTDSYHSLIIQEGHMKTGVNNLKKGNVILINNALHEVIDYYNTQPGKGGAFSQIKLRNMDTGSIFEKRFRTSESVERAHLDDKEVQYLYSDGTDFMVENCNIMVKFYEGKALTVDLPSAVTLKVTYTEPGVK